MNITRKIQVQSFYNLFILLAIIIVINILSQFAFYRFDLTKDKRYTLSAISKKQVSNLKDIVNIRVYLDGDLPPGFRKLKESTKQLLDELRVYAGDKIEYQFIDPSATKNNEDRKDLYQQLIESGLQPVNLEVVNEGDNKSQRIIFPGALLTYRDKTIALSLLQQQIGVDPEEVLNNSVVSLEYNFISTIKKLTSNHKKNIAFIEGQGEANGKLINDIYKTLSESYNVETIDLPRYKVGILDHLDLIIIAKPDSTFSDLEKYKIDQFIMKGGKVLWAIDPLLAEMDSLDKTGVGTTIEYPLNIDDLLFKYGVRINSNLVQDAQCHLIPLITNEGTPKREFRPWTYYPLVTPTSSHPIVNNINAVWFRFASSIDTVKSSSITKTILLQSSPHSRLVYNPVRISLQQIREPINEYTYNKGPQNLAVLLEGTFTSFYKNYIDPKTIQTGEYGKFLDHSPQTKMIIISDGDILLNQVSRIKEETYPLGYDRYTNQTFGNKVFIMNCIDYLLDESGILNLRSKHFQLRLLDKSKIAEEKLYWQILNIALPLIIILIFGFIYNYLRKRKYGLI